MPDGAIVLPDTASAPKDYKLVGTQEIQLKSVRALIDGTGAGSSFLPTLQLLDPNGHVCWEGPANSTVAAGGSADVSWFPGLSKGSSSTTTAGLGTMLATQRGGANQTLTAGVTTALSWAEIKVDSSGTFGDGGGSGTDWTINTAGQYQILLSLTPNANWPATGSGAVVFEVDLHTNFLLVAGQAFQTDGTLNTALLVGMFSTGLAALPAQMKVGIRNFTGSNIDTNASQTFLTCERLGDEVDF